ncbi:ABC transporter ATP-binding protein [Corynebacterium suedekumii]|nr:ABC transporter ATP-binding protein [Corynebacterium suedekumii]
MTSIRQAMGAIQRIQDVLHQEPETTDGEVAVPARSLLFDAVSFTYDGATPVLRNVNFRIEPGSKTAIVGPSGSGKSTVLALLQRFYDPTSGRILLGDQDIADLTPASVRSVVGLVEQEAAVLAGTVRENLRLGSADVDDDRLWWALDQVNLRSRFEESDGLNTVLGDRGVSLSEDNANASPWPACCSWTPRSSCSTSRPAPSTPGMNNSSSTPSTPPPRDAPWSSSPTGCPPSPTPTASSSCGTGRSRPPAHTPSYWRRVRCTVTWLPGSC